MHVKFCGFTQLADIHTATQLGVDAVGLVFYSPSPRAVSQEQAQNWLLPYLHLLAWWL